MGKKGKVDLEEGGYMTQKKTSGGWEEGWRGLEEDAGGPRCLDATQMYQFIINLNTTLIILV